ncbi:acyltransferase [Alkalihalobacillus sp. LMS39]|uniref:acyltransferase family protein n=1 Tax=Alkalihalobacillus sp. LMS39 TaxID=2924032 RepID=UPI001FB24BA0|nr:acyltransferase [Alkalihalobacillus sp. LMS39]UOE92241.1 acyltransferase [Alkalihalobacillus sp. LMS39]
MELTKDDSKILKGIAIILMVLLHLFCRKEIEGFYTTYFYINDNPVVYYIGLFGDACRPIYLFVTGYAFYLTFIDRDIKQTINKNMIRIFKLFMNFWIMLLLFLLLSLLLGRIGVFGSIQEFLLNFTLLDYSYNGAWWFLQIYIIIVLLSPLLIKIAKNTPIALLLPISGIIYVACYLQFYKSVLDFGPLSIIESQLCLIGTSQFSFFIGALFSKYKWLTKIYNTVHHIKFKNALCMLGVLSLIIFHGFFESAIIAPVNGIFFIVLFSLMTKKGWVTALLQYISSHSTNIWLTHMFFYTMMFPGLAFLPNSPLLVFIWTMALCIIASYIIKLFFNPLSRGIDKRLKSKNGDPLLKIS